MDLMDKLLTPNKNYNLKIEDNSGHNKDDDTLKLVKRDCDKSQLSPGKNNASNKYCVDYRNSPSTHMLFIYVSVVFKVNIRIGYGYGVTLAKIPNIGATNFLLFFLQLRIIP